MSSVKKIKITQIGAGFFMTDTFTTAVTRANTAQTQDGGEHIFELDCMVCRTQTTADKAVGLGFKRGWAPEEQGKSADPEKQKKVILNFVLDQKPDVVRIAVPDLDHAFYSVPLLKAGTIVLQEKALADSLENGRNIVRAAEAEGAGKIAIQYNYPWFAAAAQLAKLIAEERICTLNPTGFYHVVYRFLQDWCIGEGGQENWRHKEIGWNVLADLLTHCFAFDHEMRKPLADPIISASASIRQYEGVDKKLRLLRPDQVEDKSSFRVHAAQAIFSTESGATITADTGRHMRISKADMGYKIHGYNGNASWELSRPNFCGYDDHRNAPLHGPVQGGGFTLDSYVPGLQAGFEDGHMRQALAVLKWLDGGRQGAFPGTTPREAFLFLRYCEMVLKAGLEKREVLLSEIPDVD